MIIKYSTYINESIDNAKIGDILYYDGMKKGMQGREVIVVDILPEDYMYKIKFVDEDIYNHYGTFNCAKKFLKNAPLIKLTEEDPYGEEDWNESIRYNESIEDLNIIKNYLITYKDSDEMIKVAKKLNDLGFKVYNYDEIVNTGELMFKGFSWNNADQSFNRSGKKKDPIDYDTLVKLTDSNKKYVRLSNKEFDPYDEEDWGFSVQESYEPTKYEIGDQVIINGIIDGEEFINAHDVISDISLDNLETNMDKDGECVSYRYKGTAYYMEGHDWWVTPYNLRKPIVTRNYTDDDPYGEENVNEDIIYGRQKFEPIGDILTGIKLMEIKKKTDLMGTKKEYEVNITKPFRYYGEPKKRTISPLDPYGEEDWDN